MYMHCTLAATPHDRCSWESVVNIYIYIYICIHTHIYIYIYIERYRDRERERDRCHKVWLRPSSLLLRFVDSNFNRKTRV